MRKRNWKKYNPSLVKRGSIDFYIDANSLLPPGKKKKARGRPTLFSHPLIQLLLMLKIQYRLTYRSLEGFTKSLLPRIQQCVSLPSYSLICKRASRLEALLPKLSKRKAHVVLIDSTGIKVAGEGEWKVKTHGKTGKRKWIKIHVAIDAKSQEVLCLEITDGHTADCSVGPKLIESCPSSVETFIADGGYDTVECRRRIQKRGAKALIPPRKNGISSPGLHERNQAISERRGLGLDAVGIGLWGKLTGYSQRALVETTFSRLKGLYGPMFYSKKTSSQRVEGGLKCLMMNQMMSLRA